MIPSYWEKAKCELSCRDEVLSSLIGRYPGISLVRRADSFSTLARSIVGQQISVKAAESVWQRVLALAPAATPEQMLKARRRLAACGLSQRKAEYIADLARHFADGRIHARAWPQMEDEAVIAELVQVRGIGRWTAQMFLIFNLLRPDVLPLDDLGLQRAIGLHYFDGERVALERMRALASGWAPWRSVATWYLWRSLDPLPVEY